ncbi:isoprenoid biosynthesis glyoxalase ElbB [Marinospirillum insulare]|uniref:Glyoxalase n=1 Tax=Marinospirillum insulare TaxID=217169 RepID=A0ABQ5ZXA0_9GAMM|nr:isoprenoid biosynthesis glyoxalase ElbB [Marinospirillum insulare]GLR62962.1 glyoxalase [Marinospirillum insulare]
MKKKVALLIAGCGVYDGAEIYETVLTLLRLDEQDADYQFIAPDKPLDQVINHLTGEEVKDSQPEGAASRNLLVEAARLARGDIIALSTANPEDYDAVILPGGFGVAKNFSTFAKEGADCSLDSNVQAFVQAFFQAEKPIGLMCITPAITAKLIKPGILCTVGDDAAVEGAMASMGSLHKSCSVDEIVVDNNHKVVTTPAYMLANRITEAKAGIFKLVDKVLELA